MTKPSNEMLTQIAHTIRGLSIDAIDEANSGHPGLPLGCAEIAAYLYGYALKHNPKNPKWKNRDRFVLSAGHGSMLLYSALHLAGFDVSLNNIKQFRKLNSPTAGHPEFGHVPGVETTTGPLGQGVAMAAGMALGNKIIQDRFELPQNLWDGKVVVLAGDGCMMEGISSETGSFSGHLALNNLIVFYDANDICLDGPTSECFTENIALRFEAQGWNVQQIDGHDLDAIHAAYQFALESTKPTLIVAKTTIGKFSPATQGSSEAHGKALGLEESKKTKAAFNWPEMRFYVPDSVSEFFANKQKQDQQMENDWTIQFQAWKNEHATRANQWDAYEANKMPDALIKATTLAHWKPNRATRSTSNSMIQLIHEYCPYVQGGSADLSCSDNTMIQGSGWVTSNNFAPHNIKYGAREFAMGAIAVGLGLHGMFVPFCGTFLMFSDYMRNSIRLAALMNVPIIYQFTHDSVWLGEDGPTHQPIEHLASLRAMPQLIVARPADATEVKGVWLAALAMKEPVAMILSRQGVPDLVGTDVEKVKKGAYIVLDETEESSIDYCILASGSEVSLAIDVAKTLIQEGHNVRVVSMCSFEWFNQQPRAYQERVLGTDVGQMISIEAHVSLGWHQYIGRNGLSISIETFGKSGEISDLKNAFGFTKEKILRKINVVSRTR